MHGRCTERHDFRSNVENVEFLEMDEEAYNSELTQSAKDRLKEELVADLVIEKAKIDVSEEALKKKYEEQKRMVEETISKADIHTNLLVRGVLHVD